MKPCNKSLTIRGAKKAVCNYCHAHNKFFLVPNVHIGNAYWDAQASSICYDELCFPLDTWVSWYAFLGFRGRNEKLLMCAGDADSMITPIVKHRALTLRKWIELFKLNSQHSQRLNIRWQCFFSFPTWKLEMRVEMHKRRVSVMMNFVFSTWCWDIMVGIPTLGTHRYTQISKRNT